MSILSEIVARKRERLDIAKERVPISEIRDLVIRARANSEPHKFLGAFQSEAINIIAEFKRRSPSRGLIRSDVEISEMVKSYQTGGAAAVSILTEEDYFDGSLDDLRKAKEVIDLPVLRKDFVFDEYQIFEAASAGADAVLLIVAALDDQTLANLREIAEDELGLDALVEVHDASEMSRALKAGGKFIGVNNRNLHTFEVTLQTSLALANEVPPGVVLISESGLKDADDLLMLHDVGYRGFLIGETLMRADEPAEMLRSLIRSQVSTK